MNEGMQWSVLCTGALPKGDGKTRFEVEVEHDRKLTDDMTRRICDAVTKAVALELVHINQEIREGRL